MRRGTRNLLFSALAFIALLVVGGLGYLSLVFSDWPDHHTSRPHFAGAVNQRYWSTSDERSLNAALTRALMQDVGKHPSVANLVEVLDEQGFLAVQ
jgi:hypothetical protein